MFKLFRIAFVVMAACLGFILGLMFNGHYDLQLVMYLDNQLVDLTNAEAVLDASRTGRAEWIARYGNIQLSGWHYAYSVPLLVSFILGLLAFLVSGLFKSKAKAVIKRRMPPMHGR
jgi:hypothetical protein